MPDEKDVALQAALERMACPFEVGRDIGLGDRHDGGQVGTHVFAEHPTDEPDLVQPLGD